ncbi:hypothetical protein E4O04_08855 [Treponema sp. OMZ 799]|uniref:hypothetical protein n=1 Tax=Treponema sp. OMZ 799 TaxID=2563668 RepID=UPI0020A55362|nr:hypothetical protein [Treponema sp. OMZ 799]UTC78101.1 hypothetical protein E4O04_08855 [Treponema sp. OMZ 799]
MKRSFLFLLFVFCFLPAVGQQAEYMMTESELMRLESLLEKLENTKQMQLSQIQSLETELSEAQKYQENLTDQLTQARLSLKKSEKSLEEYERESMNVIAKKEKTIQEKQKKIEEKREEIAELKIKNYKLKLALVILSCVLGVFILGGVGFFILKMKLKLRRF